jgi:hypothetical protein
MSIRTWLVDIDAHNGTSVTTLRFSSDSNAFANSRDFLLVEGTDDLLIEEGSTDRLLLAAPGIEDPQYYAVLKEPGDFSVSLFSASRTTGAGQGSFGTISITNANGDWDGIDQYGYDGRAVTVRRGDAATEPDDFVTFFKGTIDSVQTIYAKGTPCRFEFSLRDRWSDLRKPIQTVRYAGTNSGATGVEGTANDIKNQVKPLAYGEIYNATAIPVNTSDLTYQVHNGQIEEITTVYDAGVVLVKDTAIGTSGDFSTVALLKAATIGAGKYATCLAEGYFRLASLPAGKVTVTFKGSKTGGVYVSSVSDIVKRIVKDQGGFVDADLNLTSFTDLNTANNAVVGVYVESENDISAVLEVLLDSIGAFAYFTRTGIFTVGRFTAPSTGDSVAAFGTVEVIDLERRTTGDTERGIPAWKINLSYKRSFTVQDEGELAGSVAADHRAFVGNEYRVSTSEDASVKTKYLLSEEINRESLLVSSAAADTEAARLRDLYKVYRTRYIARVQTDTVLNLNDTVILDLGRLDLSNKPFKIIGITEVAGKNERTLELWG